MFRRLIFFLLIFSLPFQLGYHFWLPQSFVKSFRLDYLSPTLYLTDVFIIIYLLSHLKKITLSYLHLAFLVLIAVNITVTSFNPVTILAWLRLTLYFVLFTTLTREKNLLQKVSLPFLSSLLFILFLEFAQLILQHSVGGIFWFVGERTLSLATPNVAKLNLPFSIFHLPSIFLRPYSTFSHPNSLAGYLLVSLLLLPLFSKSKVIRYLLIAGIILTFSKAALVAILLPLPLLALPLNIIPLVSLFINLPHWLVQSFSSRAALLLVSVKLLSDRWAFGVGLRQFIPALAEILPPNQLSYTALQPVHNLFLLITTEVGIIPLAIIIAILLKFRKIFTTYYMLLATILITGALDHYWWTLPQNQLIIVLALSIIRSTKLPSPKLGEGGTASAGGEV